MTTMIGFHEVEDGEHWAKAWKKGPGSRHEMFAKAGVAACRTFRDPKNSNTVGVLLDVTDIEKFQALMESDEGKQAMAEDRLKVETLRILVEFTP